MIFFTSDTHLGHSNIIRYCNRPFRCIEEMDEAIVDKWNKKVKPNDVVYHIGDFVFKNSDIIKRLNGKIIVTTGDHDKSLNKSLVEYHYQQVLRVDVGGVSIYCLHWCMRVWPKSHFNSWHLYGHSHGKLEPIGKSHDIGVDNNNFEPVSIDEITEIMKNRPNNPNLIIK